MLVVQDMIDSSVSKEGMGLCVFVLVPAVCIALGINVMRLVWLCQRFQILIAFITN